MSTLTDKIKRGLRRTQDDLDNQTFEWEDEAFFCIPSSIHQSYLTGFGIDEPVLSVNLTVLLTNEDGNPTFSGDLPAKPDKVIFRNITFVIQQVVQDATGVFIVLKCEQQKGTRVKG